MFKFRSQNVIIALYPIVSRTIEQSQLDPARAKKHQRFGQHKQCNSNTQQIRVKRSDDEYSKYIQVGHG